MKLIKQLFPNTAKFSYAYAGYIVATMGRAHVNMHRQQANDIVSAIYRMDGFEAVSFTMRECNETN